MAVGGGIVTIQGPYGTSKAPYDTSLYANKVEAVEEIRPLIDIDFLTRITDVRGFVRLWYKND